MKRNSKPRATMASSTKRPKDHTRSLYVGDLALDVTDKQLIRKFAAVGPVESVFIVPHKHHQAGKETLSHAFVNFRNSEDAERALKKLHFAPMGKAGKLIRLMRYQEECPADGNVYVKNIPRTMDDKALHKLMVPFGTILSCKIDKDSKGNSLGYGFVQYETVKAAKSAIKEMNGADYLGHDLYVSQFQSKNERHNFYKKLPTAGSTATSTSTTTKTAAAAVVSPIKEKPEVHYTTPPKNVWAKPDGESTKPVVTAVISRSAGAITPAGEKPPVEEKPFSMAPAPGENKDQDVPDVATTSNVVVPVCMERMASSFGGIGSRPSSAIIHSYRNAIWPPSEEEKEDRYAEFSRAAKKHFEVLECIERAYYTHVNDYSSWPHSAPCWPDNPPY
ncbi:putative Polyadenylate-binding protein, cytoplasmic and nuclear [Hypsibius exemplaris]|uniref:Polyadenylate-binding protein, cytoplasmic and nuclear n=1 Tax=Hypsibius exemplaris TaxID=2072580 RepID=A0A1W0WCN5_HYPEX|nr:putative Polyadenylate-binding protein, cytoplasmic and nuclear [Hypsibius exemplaris]